MFLHRDGVRFVQVVCDVNFNRYIKYSNGFRVRMQCGFRRLKKKKEERNRFLE